MNYKFSVIIPLYNKRGDIASTLRSVAQQSYAPYEIIVVDDGSTDGGGDVVLALDIPNLRLIRQENVGECATRNRAIREANGDWFALLDADDEWEEDYLLTIASLIDLYPDCGAYFTAFKIITKGGATPSNSPKESGVVENYFSDALRYTMCMPSATTLCRRMVEQIGGFPEGMKLGGDQYMWVKMISNGWRACYSSQRMMRYNTIAANRSNSIYKAQVTAFDFSDFLSDDLVCNEYLAKVELNRGLVVSSKGDTKEGLRLEGLYGFTRRFRFALMKLRIMNRLPLWLRGGVLHLYNRCAWILVRRGL